MMKASIRSNMLVLLLCANMGNVHAAMQILHEAEPIHLAGCPLRGDPALVRTTLAFAEQSSAVYQAGVVRTNLSGSLVKREHAASADSLWDASALLDRRSSARRIFTSDGEGNLIPLAWDRLDSAQREMLDRSPVTTAGDGLGQRRLRYLVGERVDEQGQSDDMFARRDGLLGAIVHGVPLRVGRPANGLHSPGYQAFLDTHRDRRPVVYAGAADGMLHAFDDASGAELFAYVPRALFEKLPLLTAVPRSGMVVVDGGMAVADVLVGSQWRSVLAVGIGRGAQGVMALDVSNPEDFGSADHLLWEFTDRDDPDVGDVIGSPVIARFRTGGGNGAAQYVYFVMVASGVNNGREDGEGRRSATGSNALFLLALDKKKSEPWKAGVNYFKFVAAAGDRQRANGMLELSAVVGVDNAVERVYAGDLQGNLWRFDFSGALPWGKASGKPPQLLFVAQDASGNRQVITHKPAVVFAPGGGHLVLFGTGQYIARNDLNRSDFSVQSFYAVLDRGDAAIQRRELALRTLVQKEGGSILEIDGEAFDYGVSGSGRKGWMFDFPASASTGERAVSPLVLVGTNLLFNSLLPAAESCQPPTGRFYMVNTLTGLAANARLTGMHISNGAPASVLLRASMEQGENRPDATGKRRLGRSVEIVQGDAPAIVIDAPASTASLAGRLSWRELVNWSEMRRSAQGKQKP